MCVSAKYGFFALVICFVFPFGTITQTGREDYGKFIRGIKNGDDGGVKCALFLRVCFLFFSDELLYMLYMGNRNKKRKCAYTSVFTTRP